MAKKTNSKRKSIIITNSYNSKIDAKSKFKKNQNKRISKNKKRKNSPVSLSLKKTNNDYNNNKTTIDLLRKILNRKNYSNEYKRRIINLFQDFLYFNFKDKTEQIKFHINITDKNCKTKFNRININNALKYVERNNNFKSESTRYFVLLKLRKFIRILNKEENLNYNKKLASLKKYEKFYINDKELYSIINNLKDDDNHENLCIFYFLFIKGFNYSMISRILLTDFKLGFSQLVIKQGKKMKYSISNNIKEKLLFIMRNTDFHSKFFFYNNIIENKNNRRAAFIKESFKNIIDNCIGIDEERKKPLLDLFSIKRKAKKLFREDFFFNDISYTYGYFNSFLTPFATPKKGSEEEEENISESSLTNNNDKNGFSEWSEDSSSKKLEKFDSNPHSINNAIEDVDDDNFFIKRERENDLNFKKKKQ